MMATQLAAVKDFVIFIKWIFFNFCLKILEKKEIQFNPGCFVLSLRWKAAAAEGRGKTSFHYGNDEALYWILTSEGI